MSKYKCTNVETISWCEQRVTLDSAKASIVVTLKDQNDFNGLKKGDEVEVSFDSKKRSSVKLAKEKVAKAPVAKKQQKKVTPAPVSPAPESTDAPQV